ncbi:hypothetical protein [Dietzia alimentaria]|uniref:hypothetical protein n=1 Tax=Dietzia alimentaria TaxID=665550 RepID=UPI00029B1C26|nr:hypothetical protein [Dietzia alimentaria]
MRSREETASPAFRDTWAWLGSGAIALALLVAVVVAAPRLLDRDPCDIALRAASELGLKLSDDDAVVSCEWHSSFPDSSGAVMVRTASITSREALLKRSGVSEEITGTTVSINDGPFRSETRRPNLERSTQVYLRTGPTGHILKISYDEGLESGLLLRVSAIEM